CSTPLGVTAFDTTFGLHRSGIDIGCSTPLGVTAFDTRRTRTSKPAPRVLNASRRHCVRHYGCHGPGSVSPSGAQRLSASLLSTHTEHAAGCRTCSCSTPLGAAAFDTRTAPPRRGVPRRVLNASRRHCVRHTGGDAKCGRVPVRAQRLSASLRSTQPEVIAI